MYFTLVRYKCKSKYNHDKQNVEEKNKNISFDSFPIMKVKNQLYIKISNKLPNVSQIQPTSFSEYIKIRPSWIRELIKNYKHDTNEETLLYHINRQKLLIISTYGTKGCQRSGGSWIIALHNGIHIASGYNSTFGHIRKMHSYCAKIYASLSTSLFIYHYAKYFIIAIVYECLAIYDNLAFINKLSWLMDNDINSHGLHKSTEQEVLSLILKIISDLFQI